MKGKYFFIENRREVEIQEFDYKYVLNSLLKEYDRRVQRKYCYTIIVSRTYDSLGNPNFDVRTLELDKIFFDNQRLNMMDLMRDEIHFKNLKIQNLPMPPLQREYMEWKEGKVKQRADLATANVPAPIVHTKKEISADDERLCDIIQIMDKTSVLAQPYPVAMKALDWVVNLPACTQEIGNTIQSLSEKQMELNSVLQQHSDYINHLMDKLTIALEGLFPLKPSFTQKLFGKEPTIKVSSNDLPKVMKALNEAVKYDTEKFSGLEPLFEELRQKTTSIKENLECGKIGCEYAIVKIEDHYEYELTQERLMKMEITNSMTETNLTTVAKRYKLDVSRMMDIQTTTIPLIIMRLQNQIGQSVDEDTVNIIKNLAYGNKE